MLQQQFGPGASEGHGYFSKLQGQFVWWGWINGRAPKEQGVPAWDSCLSVSRRVSYDPGPSSTGDFDGQLLFYPVAALETLRRETLANRTLANVEPGMSSLPAGDCLDIELNATWPHRSVPLQFGSIGVSVLGGTEVLISSGAGGSLSMGGVPLSRAGSARPTMLSLRVLVDRSVVEAFAQQGRATHAQMVSLKCYSINN